MNKNQTYIRALVLYVCFCVFASCIVYKIIQTQFINGAYWKNKFLTQSTRMEEMDAMRGNIFDINGALLATSLPYYEIAVDVNVPNISNTLFRKYRDSLALCFNALFPEKSVAYYMQLFQTARNKNDRYVFIKNGVRFAELQTIKKFPLFRNGSKWGLITLQHHKRERPFNMLAARTIGLSRQGIKPVGLEGAYDSILKGVRGKRLMQRIARDIWKPLNDENEVEPKDGQDLYTTIDINIQDVAEQALMRALQKHGAAYGCAILMEVATGEIRAIANLSRNQSDSSLYNESLNYALGYPTEPGSTFKLASVLAVLDTCNVELHEPVRVGNGTCTYFDRQMKDSHEPPKSVLTLQECFEQSSNVGISKLVQSNFGKRPDLFISYLKRFHFDRKLELTIPGEGNPRIKLPQDIDWYGTSLPWISIGYESLITPLQLLTLYNAVANNGKMVKPRFVRSIKQKGHVSQQFETEVLNEQIVKPQTIVKARQLLEGVVKNGTGKILNIPEFSVGGKTGTAQIAKKGGYKKGGVIYQGSFVGYFPADNPLYSCIVIVNAPQKGEYYGGRVAAPVFKEIAQTVYYGTSHYLKDLQPNGMTPTLSVQAYLTSKGDAAELKALMQQLKTPKPTTDGNLCKQNLLELDDQLKQGLMPDLSGLSAKDVLFILERRGLRVQLSGSGRVKRQSIDKGMRIQKGEKIILQLS
jgi:cell division protein FtsI (penicillin-binding protein 3)